MRSVHILKENNVKESFKVKKIMSDYDVKMEHSNLSLDFDIDLSNDWKVGIIVGSSGSGKTTIAKELFKENYDLEKKWDKDKSVLDCFDKSISIDEITRMFGLVGFSSIPSWLKPFSVLSNGEKMRVELARKLLEDDIIVFDEFTSVVDRQTAKIMCLSLNKILPKLNKKFVGIACHFDILEWLNTDWVFDTNELKQSFYLSHATKKKCTSKSAKEKHGENLASIII